MRVLIACECTGRVRESFAAQGHDAWSCDVKPSHQPGNHIQGNVLDVLNQGWDLMIAHPPCTYLSNVGNAWMKLPGRLELREQAMMFFMELVNAPIPRIAIENPVGYPSRAYRKPDQIIHPYYFGDRDMKRTCLWLKNLPKLWYWNNDDLFGKRTATEVPEPYYVDYTGKKRYFVDAKFKSGSTRSDTFPAIAQAMANQWGCSFG